MHYSYVFFVSTTLYTSTHALKIPPPQTGGSQDNHLDTLALVSASGHPPQLLLTNDEAFLTFN